MDPYEMNKAGKFNTSIQQGGVGSEVCSQEWWQKHYEDRLRSQLDHPINALRGATQMKEKVNPAPTKQEIADWGTVHPSAYVPSARPIVTRSFILDEAKGLTGGSREADYGTPEDNFERIAKHWEVYFHNRFGLTVPITPADVSLLMGLVKVARLEHKIDHKDSWVDLAGYAACGGECALKEDG